MESGYVYILRSLKDFKTYAGSTNDLLSRIREHNNGKVKTTKYRRPLKLIYKEDFVNLSMARKREQFFKTTSGRRELRKILQPIIAG